MSFDASLIFLLTIAATGGAALWRLGHLEARMRELEAFRSRAGERLGKLEESTRHLRRLTGAQGNPVVDAGGRVLGPVDDTSSER